MAGKWRTRDLFRGPQLINGALFGLDLQRQGSHFGLPARAGRRQGRFEGLPLPLQHVRQRIVTLHLYRKLQLILVLQVLRHTTSHADKLRLKRVQR